LIGPPEIRLLAVSFSAAAPTIRFVALLGAIGMALIATVLN
jgi:hypothetical protein